MDNSEILLIELSRLDCTDYSDRLLIKSLLEYSYHILDTLTVVSLYRSFYYDRENFAQLLINLLGI